RDNDRPRAVPLLHQRDLEAALRDQPRGRPVPVTPSGDTAPHRREAVLPADEARIRRATVLGEDQPALREDDEAPLLQAPLGDRGSGRSAPRTQPTVAALRAPDCRRPAGESIVGPMGSRENRAAAAVDPVCGMDVDPGAAAGRSAEHAGVTYWFCSPGCREKFVADPERYGSLARATGPASTAGPTQGGAPA